MDLLPISKTPPVSSRIGVPEMVSPGPPAERVVPSIGNAVGLAVKVCPPTVNTIGFAEGIVMALVPMSKIPPVSRRIGVPDIVMPGPPAERVVPSIGNVVGLAVKIWPPTVNTGFGFAEGSVMLLLPMSKIPLVSSRTGVPEIVTPGPPAERVVPSIENAVGLAVKTWPPTVNTAAPGPRVGVAEGSVMLRLPMSKTASASSLTGVPDNVIPGPPAEMVVPSIENAVGFAVKTCPPTVKIAASAVEGDGNPAMSRDPGTMTPDPPGVIVCPPITYAPASLAVKV